MKISIIVPIYKAELFLSDCVSNLQKQTYKDIELILVDDGSPDRSGIVADNLALADSRIKVIHKNNGGASDARNAGVAVATGDYLLFVDADDFLRNNDVLSNLVLTLKKKNKPDVLGFNITYYFPSSNKYAHWPKYGVDITNAIDIDCLIRELVKTGTLPVSPCGKLINREFYSKSKISFIKGTIGEDIPWTIELFEKANSVNYINEYYYCYRQEVTTSVTNTYNEKKYFDLLKIIDNLVSLIPSLRFESSTKDALYSFAAYELCIAISSVHKLEKKKKQEIREKLRENIWLLKYKTNPKVRMVAMAYNVVGYWGIEFLLRFYNRYRKH